MTLSTLLDGIVGAVIGGIIGAVGAGMIQVWSFRQGKKSARADQSVSAAAHLLGTLYSAKSVLKQLPYTDAAAGSPLSYSQRGDIARPMLEDLRRALFTEVPLLTDAELVRRFQVFVDICEFIASASMDASDIHGAIKEAGTYADHLRSCLKAHIDESPIPATAPTLAITAQAAERKGIIASAEFKGRTWN